MKKNLFLTIMCIFGLMTFVKAQNDEVIIDGTVGNYSSYMTAYAPVYCAYANSISQQYYTAEEIGRTEGTIKSISFKTSIAYDAVRNLNVYLVNTDKDSFSGLTMEQLNPDDLKFWGDVTLTTNWVTIDLDTDFEYTGGNLLVCVVDMTGVVDYYDTFFDTFLCPTESAGPYRCLWNKDGSVPFDPTASEIEAYEYLGSVPYLKLTFGESENTGEEDDEEEENPSNEVIIDGTVGNYSAYMSSYSPVYCVYANSISQQYYTAEEIGKDSGKIKSIAFKTSIAYDNVRTLNIYLVNTDKDGFTSLKMEQLKGDDLLFWNDVTFTTNWVTIDLDTDFEYTGGNILLCVNDVTGVAATYDTYFDAFIYDGTESYRCLWNKDSSVPFDPIETEIEAYEYSNNIPYVKFIFTDGTESALEIPMESALSVYPNPTGDQLFVTAEENIEAVTIYNVLGAMVCDEQNVMNNEQFTMNVSDLNSGVYFVKVRTANTESVRRIVKK